MKGSDASWKDNMEPPPECQDFSDDEEEQKYKSVVSINKSFLINIGWDITDYFFSGLP